MARTRALMTWSHCRCRARASPGMRPAGGGGDLAVDEGADAANPAGMAAMTAKPYIVIPAALRRRCGLEPGDRVLLAAVPTSPR
jgi:hypothetical protein